jgi:hypothetical protein
VRSRFYLLSSPAKFLEQRAFSMAIAACRIKALASGTNWQIAAFKPELDGVAYQEAMTVIARFRGTTPLKAFAVLIRLEPNHDSNS